MAGTSTINLSIPYIKEIYGESLTWALSTEDMAEKMKLFFEDPKKCRLQADRLFEQAINNHLNINTLEQGADIIENTIKNL